MKFQTQKGNIVDIDIDIEECDKNGYSIITNYLLINQEKGYVDFESLNAGFVNISKLNHCNPMFDVNNCEAIYLGFFLQKEVNLNANFLNVIIEKLSEVDSEIENADQVDNPIAQSNLFQLVSSKYRVVINEKESLDIALNDAACISCL